MAEKAQELTNKIQMAQSYERLEKIGESIRLYEEVIKAPLTVDEMVDEAVKAKESATYNLAKIYKEQGLVDELIQL